MSNIILLKRQRKSRNCLTNIAVKQWNGTFLGHIKLIMLSRAGLDEYMSVDHLHISKSIAQNLDQSQIEAPKL